MIREARNWFLGHLVSGFLLQGAWALVIRELVSWTSRKAPDSRTPRNWFSGHPGRRLVPEHPRTGLLDISEVTWFLHIPEVVSWTSKKAFGFLDIEELISWTSTKVLGSCISMYIQELVSWASWNWFPRHLGCGFLDIQEGPWFPGHVGTTFLDIREVIS